MVRWLKLLLAFSLIGIVLWKMPAQLRKWKMYREVVQKAHELDIDNSALFYSEEPMTYQLEKELRLNLRTNEKSQNR